MAMPVSQFPPDQPEPTPILESQLMKRFGATVLRDGFTCLPNVLLLHLGKLKLSRTEFTIIAEIWQCWWSTWPFPKVGTIATRLGVSRRAVQLQLARLKAPMIEEDLQAREDGEVEIVSRVITHFETSLREGSSNITSSSAPSMIDRSPRAPVSRSSALSAISQSPSSVKTSSIES